MPVTVEEANRLVAAWHRHHGPTLGGRFALAAVEESGTIHGAAICGRPVARAVDQRAVLEVTRLVSDGHPNVCSILYAAAARAARALGYQRIQTYTLEAEAGTSLRAAGWTQVAEVRGRAWTRADGSPRTNSHPSARKLRWERTLNDPLPDIVGWPVDDTQPNLFDAGP